MRALILPTPSASPLNHENLKLIDIPLPEPGIGEVRLRLTSVGLNRGDLLYCQNRYFIQPKEGSRVGFEGAGVIDAIGPGTQTHFKPGDRVGICPMSFDVNTQGCLAEYGIYASNTLIPSPETLNDDEAGSIWMAYFTAWGGLIEAGQLKKGETVVITAASSSVGIAAIQIARMIGANTIATTTSNDKAKELKAAGANHIIVQTHDKNSKEQSLITTKIAHYVNAILAATNNQGSDLVFDAVAGPMSHALIKASRRSGRIIIHGMLDRNPMDIHAGVLMKRLLTLKGYTVDQTLTDPIQKQRAISAITAGFADHQLTPTISRQFSLADFKQAFSYLSSNQQFGKIIITP